MVFLLGAEFTFKLNKLYLITALPYNLKKYLQIMYFLNLEVLNLLIMYHIVGNGTVLPMNLGKTVFNHCKFSLANHCIVWFERN